MLSFELSAMPILNYSIWNWQTTIQNSKLKIAFGNNSKLKTQKSYYYGKENSDDHSGCGDGWR